MGPDYIGPAVDHFQEISYQYPEVRDCGELTVNTASSATNPRT